jgi:hypothetical protein
VLSVVLGGAWIDTQSPVETKDYLGLGWFVLDLLVFALIFVPPGWFAPLIPPFLRRKRR